MEAQRNAEGQKPSANGPAIDPLRRIIVPIEKRMTDGNLTFQTSDRDRYIRTPDGVIRRAAPKVNGKRARKARQLARKRNANSER